jgi:hypothetical protein
MADYVSTIPLLKVPPEADPNTSCTPQQAREFRGIMGALGWLSTMGRPDIAFSVSKLQGHVTSPLLTHLLEANQVIREARKHQDVRLLFQPLDLDSICFAAVGDASFGTMNNGKSQSGVVVLIGDRDFDQGRVGKVNFICWRSGRQKRVARSTFGAELLACGDAVDLADFCRGLWAELIGRDPVESLSEGPDLHWLTDSKDLFDNLSKDTVPHCAERRLALDLVVMRELLHRGSNRLHWIDTGHMLADGLTKGLQNHFLRHCLESGSYAWQYAADCRDEHKSPKSPPRKTALRSAAPTSKPNRKVTFQLAPDQRRR